MQSGS